MVPFITVKDNESTCTGIVNDLTASDPIDVCNSLTSVCSSQSFVDFNTLWNDVSVALCLIYLATFLPCLVHLIKLS